MTLAAPVARARSRGGAAHLQVGKGADGDLRPRPCELARADQQEHLLLPAQVDAGCNYSYRQ